MATEFGEDVESQSTQDAELPHAMERFAMRWARCVLCHEFFDRPVQLEWGPGDSICGKDCAVALHSLLRGRAYSHDELLDALGPEVQDQVHWLRGVDNVTIAENQMTLSKMRREDKVFEPISHACWTQSIGTGSTQRWEETQRAWLRQLDQDRVSSVTEFSAKTKQMMKLWNAHVRDENLSNDRDVFYVCRRFAKSATTSR
mmetsp:Transcript_11727/g.23885  ORF Transcript_11727/g.23885 Transcript_11727/m.23885 type:complete len:201 (-) Transcript_11727:1573-2175(-)